MVDLKLGEGGGHQLGQPGVLYIWSTPWYVLSKFNSRLSKCTTNLVSRLFIVLFKTFYKNNCSVHCQLESQLLLIVQMYIVYL